MGIPIVYRERIPMFSTHCFVCFLGSKEDEAWPPIRRDTYVASHGTTRPIDLIKSSHEMIQVSSKKEQS